MLENLGILLLAFIVVLIGGAGVVAVLVMVRLLFPGAVGRAQRGLEATPGRAFLVGLINFLFFAFIVLVGLNDGRFGQLIGMLILFVMLLLATFGLTGLVMVLNQRLGTDVSPAMGALRAGGLMVLAMLAPGLGWFVLTPLLLLASLGAGILSLWRRPSSDKEFSV